MTDVRKAGLGAAGAAVTAEELAAINAYARSGLTAEQVYVFALRLCDNEVDRDFERFDEAALHKLGELFVGKSGIFDHNWSAAGQSARIYRTEVVREPGVKTAAGDGYCWLKAWAYMLRTEKNADLIAEIEGGIKKEVSVGCSVGRRTCSICGKENCTHVPGKEYGGKHCYRTLQDPVDAYEWSFVAVPAQRRAGVVKRWQGGGGDQMVSEGYLEQLEREAALGRSYLKGLRQDLVRLACLSDQKLDGGLYAQVAEKLTEPELLELRNMYQRRVDGQFTVGAQLKKTAGAARDSGEAFLI